MWFKKQKTPNKIFLNYSTVAPMRPAAVQAAKDFLDEFATVGPPEVLYKYDPYADKLAAEAAQLLHCAADEITYIKNTSEGIIIAAESVPFGPHDEVLVMANEYPANLLPWLKKQKDGVQLTTIQGSGAQAFQTLLSSVSPHTKLVAVSTAQYYDGFMGDLAALSAACQQNGALLLLDAVQTMGIRALDLSTLHVDFVVCGGQKYLQAGPGIGFMYVNQATLPLLQDFKVGIRSMQSFTQSDYNVRTTAARFQDGTQNVSGIVALHAALQEINTVGIATLEQQNRAKLAQAKAILQQYNLSFIDYGDAQGNILSILVSDATALFNWLKDQHIYTKAIKDVLRISFTTETPANHIEIAAKQIRQWLDTQPKNA